MIMPYWPRILAGILLSIILSGITGGLAWIVKPVFDEVFIAQKYHLAMFIPIGVFLLLCTKGLVSFGQAYMMRSAGMKLVRDTRNRLYRHILHLPVSYFGREASGITVSRVMLDAENLNQLVAGVIKNFVVEIPTVLFLMGVALYRRWDLTLVTIVLLPFMAYSTRKFGKRIKKKRKEAQRKLSFLTQRIGETIQGARIIKIFNREEAMSSKFEEDGQRFYREMLRVVRTKEFTNLLIDVFTGIGISIVFWFGFSLVKNGTITPGDFISIYTAIYLIFNPVKKIGDGYTTLQEVRASIERIDTLLDAEYEDPGSRKVDGFKEVLAFEGVGFRYPGSTHPVISNIDLNIKRGEIIAIVGRSGVGKSTLIDLIPRFNRPSEGVIRLDGTDLNEIEASSLRGLIGIVSQDIILFNDTIRENILFGRPDATEEEMKKAAELAYAADFINELENGYDTVIGERGLKLSGGQRQRIAIARAILKNPPILIMDEATSSLDSVSEALVQKALESLMTSRTTIVIAHRLSTIKNADRIVVLDKGTVNDIGKHDELMQRNEVYAKLYRAFSAEEDL